MVDHEKGFIPHEPKGRRTISLVGFAFSVLVLAIGALMIASSVVSSLSGNPIIFGNTDPVLELFLGIAFVVIAANLISFHAPIGKSR